MRHRTAVEISIEHWLSTALVETVNTKLRLTAHIAFGFHNHTL
ncbi:transposase [Micromonospora narathiwatensis]|nr:transposase [Micromonospora narathiwatensis]